MQNAIALAVVGLIAVAVTGMGSTYLAAPQKMVGSFGLKLPALDADTRAWLRLKGIRDVGSGLVVLALMLLADRRTLGIALLAFAIIPFGDMAIVLASGGSRLRAFTIHGLTFAVMLLAGLSLIHVL